MPFEIGLQLFTLRDELEKDFEGTLEQVSKIGLKYVEIAGYYGKSAQELKDVLSANNLKCVSAHIFFDDLVSNTQKHADMISTLGAEYVAIPIVSEDYLAGGLKYGLFLDMVQKMSEIFNSNGIKLLYHNHDFEFNKHENRYKLDLLFEALSLNTLQFEPDTCWIRYAGVDPCSYLQNFEKRCPVVHLKDFAADSASQSIKGIENGRYMQDKQADNFIFKSLGQGVVDIKGIINTADMLGTKYFIIEQDLSPELPAIKCVKQSFEYLKNI